MLPWLLYLTHQFGQWAILRQAQRAKERGEVKWPAKFEGDASAPLTPEDYKPNLYAQRMFALNISMVIIKFIQSRITYDGLANEVPEVTALGSVAIWILFSIVIQMPNRGVFF